MTAAADVARLESERLRPMPPEEPRDSAWRRDLDTVIHVLAQAIYDDQRKGKWGNRGRR